MAVPLLQYTSTIIILIEFATTDYILFYPTNNYEISALKCSIFFFYQVKLKLKIMHTLTYTLYILQYNCSL